MLTGKRPLRGFTLIEIVITLALLALLLMAAVPAFSAWVAGAKVRSVAEVLQNGLRLAQSEATTRSRQVVFALTDSTPALTATPAQNGSNWYARVLPLTDSSETADSDDYVSGGTFATQAGVTVTGPALVCFNSLGRQVSNTATGLGSDCTAPTSAVEPVVYTVSRTGADRSLKVQVYLGGKIRMCDAAKTLSAGAPDGC